MKVKLSQVLLLSSLLAGGGGFEFLSAKSLEETIKDIDVSGVIRYRYDTGRYDNPSKIGYRDGRGLVSSSQNHRFLANFNFKAQIEDNIKSYLQLRYGPTKEGGYGASSSTDTSKPLKVRQIYVQYALNDYNSEIIAGKQQMNSIWTENYYDGLVAMGLKVVNNSLDNISLQAFAYDSYNDDEQGGRMGDMAEYKSNYADANQAYTQAPFYKENFYGVAALGDHKLLAGNLNSQLWLGYLNQNAFFYALDLGYTTSINDINLSFQGTYLGNSVESDFKDNLNGDNGNFFGAKASLNVSFFDANIGGMFYGDKDKYTIVVLEDTGNLTTIGGQEIFYTDGSHLNGDRGENAFVYGGLGFSVDKLRVGADFAYGSTKTAIAGLGGEKLELVGRISYKYSPKLNFITWYSHINIDTNDPSSLESIDSKKDTVRFQALYKF